MCVYTYCLDSFLVESGLFSNMFVFMTHDFPSGMHLSLICIDYLHVCHVEICNAFPLWEGLLNGNCFVGNC